MAADVELVRRAWEAFSRGDLAAVEAFLAPGVRWYGADDPDFEGACRSRSDAAAFIKQSLADGVSAELLVVLDAGDRVVAVIRTMSRRTGSSRPTATAKWSPSATARCRRWWSTRRLTTRSSRPGCRPPS